MKQIVHFIGLPVYEDIQNQIKQALIYGKVSSIVEGPRFAKNLTCNTEVSSRGRDDSGVCG